MQLLPDAVVRVRRCRWRVVAVRQHERCAIVTLRGLEPPVAGEERRLLSPFDQFDRVDASARPLRVSRARWRAACRAALAADTPPGGLRAAALAQIELMPFQLEPALAIVRGHGCRVLLADEVGLGKTIQAALIATELRARGAATRILVIAPAGLRDQWTAELHDRFKLPCRLIDAAAVRHATASLPREVDPWSTFEVAVSSVDFLKRHDVVVAAARHPWDVVIVDEAHGVASDSDRRAAVQMLCARAAYVLLLTATPHSGDRDAFASLCAIGTVGDDALLTFRRTRRDARTGGRRRVCTLRVRLSAPERRLHTALRRFSDAVLAERPDAWLALSVLHKRAFSSAAALADSIDRRLAALDGAEPPAAVQLDLPLDADGELTGDDDEPRWAAELRFANVERERQLLVALARAARAASQREAKVSAILRMLRRVNESVLIFTEYRDTLRHVLRAIGRPAVVIHGGLTREERRAAVEAFTRRDRTIMLATDAAGEGLNLHHACRIVINLELPWNPVRLEQRIGRVDRIGQRRAVHAVHLVARGTGEAALLARLRARIAVAQASLGAPDPFGAAEDHAAAEIVVLRRTPSTAAGDGSEPCTVDSAELRDLAHREARRLGLVRRVSTAGRRLEPSRPWSMRARTRLRRRLGERRLEVWRTAAADGRGEVAASQLLGVLADQGVDPDRVRAAVEGRAATWRAATVASVAAFTSARLRRAIAVSSAEAAQAASENQPSLFSDRRRAREELMTTSERTARRERLEQRVADARAASVLSFRQPELMLVAEPS